jgi:hypothetical protein
MATKATPVTEKDKGKAGVQEVTAEVPGVGPVSTYFRIEFVDDLTGKPGNNTQTVKLRFPHEADNEIVETDDQGEPLKNDDGTEKITTEKFIAYEEMVIDLSEPSFAELVKVLAPYREVARPAPVQSAAPIRTRTASHKKDSASTEWNSRLKEWARTVGHKVNDRGRIPAEIVEAYTRANPSDPRPSE